MSYLEATRAVRLHFRVIRAGKSTWIKFKDIRSSFLSDFSLLFIWISSHKVSNSMFSLASDILFLEQNIAINQLIVHLSVSKVMVDL